MRKLLRLITILFFKIFYSVEVIGRQNIPEHGPVLLCSNHIGELDMFFIGYKIKRWVHYMAKEELFAVPLIGTAIRLLGAFPVKRGKGDIRAVKTAMKLLDEGRIVGIFPEGTRTRGKPRNPIKVKPGSALFAIKCGVPIVPVAIKGSYRIFSKVKVIFGKPFMLDIDRNKKYTKEEMTHISENIMNRVYALMEEY